MTIGRLMGVVVLALLMVGVVACVPITPPAVTPAPTEESAEGSGNALMSA